MTMPRSLAGRLFAAAALWSVVVLVGVGVTLSEYYRSAAERAYDERLHLYLRSLVFDLASHGDLAKVNVANIGDPRFEFPLSGWYWQVSRYPGDVNELKASRSLFDQTLPKLLDMDEDKDPTAAREAYVDGPDGQRLRQVERVVTMSDGEQYLLAVAGDAADITAEIRSFNLALSISFAILGLGLFVVAAVQVRWGLRPLTAISGNIAAIRAGRSDRISEDVPIEVAPLARELNALIESNREIIERARTHVGNLAHALKTPLSVITNEAAASKDSFATKIIEQAQTMRTQIDHHLERARIAAGTAMVGAVTDVAPVIESLGRAMRKVHQDRNIEIEARSDALQFRGERQDLEEMVGNLLDNACKWASGRVSVRAEAEPSALAGGRHFLSVMVEDDGPGLTSEQCEEVLKRGRRLDESKPGSGLGLAIVSDLAVLYGGRLDLGRAPLGGLRVTLRLPAV
jgi:signal transduction histidine kinase